MSATRQDCVFAWLDVARSALERAAECAAAAEIEALGDYEAQRDEVEQTLREAEFDMHMSEIVLERLTKDRRAA